MYLFVYTRGDFVPGRRSDDVSMQGFSYVGPYVDELEHQEGNTMQQDSESDNSYVSASVSEYSEDGMMEDYYE